jgi:hypothetical protein
MKKTITIIGIVAIVLGAVAAIAWLALGQYNNSQQSKATETAQIFVEDLVANKASTAYKQLSTELQKKVTLESFTQEFKPAFIAEPEYIKTTSVKTSDGKNYVVTRDVGGYPAAEDGSTEFKYTMVLVQEDGTWKIDSVTAQ